MEPLTMKSARPLALFFAAIIAALLLGGCDGDDDGSGDSNGADAGPGDGGVKPFDECFGTPESFVRQAELALVGHRPRSQGEVDVYAALYRGVLAKDGAEGPADHRHARRVVARALMELPEFGPRWERVLLDRLRVQRIDDQDMSGCYGARFRPADDGELARAVVGTMSAKNDVPGGTFTMRDLLVSSVAADDLTPIYRGHLYALISRPIPAANVPEDQAELARQEDFGASFDAVYLNRDIVCLGCHNSEFSTTFEADPMLNRHWPVPGLFEKALYGESSGVDPTRAHAMFRFDGFAYAGGDLPWGWSDSCGVFQASGIGPDRNGLVAKFGGIGGSTATVYDTEAMLARGFAKLREDGLAPGAGGEIADPDVAFAYLVSMNIVDGLWTEVTGSSLTIANYFPRNQASRDLLHLLTEVFVESGFSLRAVLEEIVVSAYFDRLPAAAGCGVGPYDTPAVWDPWVVSDSDPERRLNGPGDAVHALSSRTAAHAAYDALDWGQTSPLLEFGVDGQCDGSCSSLAGTCSQFGFCCYEEYLFCDLALPRPSSQAIADERAFQRGAGLFLKNAERGFRGLDFQARLEWENRFAMCQSPQGFGTANDFVDGLVARAGAAPAATLRDVVVALKDRVIADGAIRSAGEETALAAILGAPLDTPVAGVSDLETRVRRVCGVLMSSPQFLLAGSAATDAPPIPTLTPPELTFDSVCAQVAARPLIEGLSISCSAGTLTVQ